MAVAIAASVEAVAFPAYPARDVLVPPLLLDIRDVCRVERSGNVETTYFCEAPYVCGSGGCVPGPELQRQLEEEARAEQEALEAERKNIEAQIRAIREAQRAGQQIIIGTGAYTNSQRGSGCTSTISMPGDAPGNCSTTRSATLEENVYNMAGGPPRRIIRPARPTTVTQRSQIGLRQQFRFAAGLRHLAGILATLTPDAPGRKHIEDELNRFSDKALKAGVDRGIIEAARRPAGSNAPPAPGPGGGNGPAAAAGPAAQPAVPETPSATVAPDIPPGPAAPPDPPKPVISLNDQSLCEYLLTVEKDQANSLPIEIPDYCEPYLRSIGRTTTPKPDPALQQLSSADLEEATALQEIFGELLPPEGDPPAAEASP